MDVRDCLPGGPDTGFVGPTIYTVLGVVFRKIRIEKCLALEIFPKSYISILLGPLLGPWRNLYSGGPEASVSLASWCICLQFMEQ